MTRTTTTSRATRRARDRPTGRAEPADTGALPPDGGLTSDGGLTGDGGLAVVPSHSVISSSAIGPAFAARAGGAGGSDTAGASEYRPERASERTGSRTGPRSPGGLGRTGRTGSGLVASPLAASPPGASSCLVAAPERSAVTAARMRCRRSSDSTGEDDGAARAARTGPRPGRAVAVPCRGPRLPCGSIPPARYVYRAIRPHGIAQHRMGGYSSRTMKCNRKSAYFCRTTTPPEPRRRAAARYSLPPNLRNTPHRRELEVNVWFAVSIFVQKRCVR